ncbi:hypothetical protein QYF61_023369 [Mycteria americana]|uniref:Uncharacterized protein n=1 Tax=Mycteria americana TaxID=33587 RepID=A0AAN7NIQ4_MYCAM|nr:hypothetical protein QYF61_023369 [Mycteria americana]
MQTLPGDFVWRNTHAAHPFWSPALLMSLTVRSHFVFNFGKACYWICYCERHLDGAHMPPKQTETDVPDSSATHFVLWPKHVPQANLCRVAHSLPSSSEKHVAPETVSCCVGLFSSRQSKIVSHTNHALEEQL